MRTTDNNGGFFAVPEEHLDNLSFIANKNLKDLQERNPNLLIFPQSLGQYNDDVEKTNIFSLNDNKLTTYNLMGFVGRNSSQLTIASRFAKDDENDYFLHYMLQKVFAINLLDFEQNKDEENIWDFLLYLFPYYLKKAYSRGLYKAYKRQEYNDANVKGAVDVNRHIKRNIPFAGKVAYSTREHSYDNPVNQLIKHTIEFVKTHPFGSGLLANDSEVRDIVSRFNFVTQRTYNKNARHKIISANLKPISHPYFTEYKILQKLCLQILRREKLTYGEQKDNQIYGLLFDGAWLWEEYLNTILKDLDFIHPENKTGKHRQYLFENFQPFYPDFISKFNPKIVGDAKYIPLYRQKNYSENSEKAVSIYYKTITYMYRFNSTKGLLLFPNEEGTLFFDKYQIKESNGVLYKIGLAIPKQVANFKEFIDQMEENERKLKNRIDNI